MPNAYDQFDRAEQLEEVAARIYRALAERFAADPQAQSMFLRLESEELQHALRIRLLRSQYAREQRLFTGVVLELGLADALLAEGQVILRLVASAAPLTLGEARLLMARLEDRFAAVHADALAGLGDPGLRRFFAALAEQDREHRALLAATAG
jgi:rubrerythrin